MACGNWIWFLGNSFWFYKSHYLMKGWGQKREFIQKMDPETEVAWAPKKIICAFNKWIWVLGVWATGPDVVLGPAFRSLDNWTGCGFRTINGTFSYSWFGFLDSGHSFCFMGTDFEVFETHLGLPQMDLGSGLSYLLSLKRKCIHSASRVQGGLGSLSQKKKKAPPSFFPLPWS